MKPGRDKHRENQLFSRSSFPTFTSSTRYQCQKQGPWNIIRTVKALPLFSGYWFVSLWVLFFYQLPILPPCKQPRSQEFPPAVTPGNAWLSRWLQVRWEKIGPSLIQREWQSVQMLQFFASASISKENLLWLKHASLNNACVVFANQNTSKTFPSVLLSPKCSV